MSQITMADALKQVAGMDLAGLARVYKRVVGAKPPKGTKLETLKDALFDALKEQTAMEGGVEVLNDSAAKWLSEGDGKPATKKAEASAPEAKPEKPIKMPKQPKAPKPAKEPKERDPRLPAPGSTITKVWRDRTLEVAVNESDFTLDGKPYKSLSKIASELLGCPANGFLFFGLTEAAKAATAKREEKAAAKAAEDAAKTEAPATPRPEKSEKKGKAPKQTKGKNAKKSKAKTK